MKARFAWFAGLSILLSTSLLFSPFLVNAAPGRQPSTSDGEPNNSYGTATPIDVASTIQGTITPSDDEDWYTLNVDHQGELKIAITNVAPELTIDVRVWNADKSTVSDWFAPLSAGGDTSAVVDLIEAGQYYLEVADDQGNAQSDQPYSLQTTFTSTADTSEPNNDYGSATPIEIGQPLQANILPANDEDWYNFEVAKQGELTLQISNVAKEMAISVRVWNNERNAISDWISPLAKGGNSKGIIDLPSGGRYFLEVADSNGARSAQPYTLQADFVPAVDSLEPNNSIGTSSPFTLGTTIAANIIPQNDEDWYQFDVPHHGQLDVAITGVPANLAIHARVWNSNYDAISDWVSPLSAGGNTMGSVDLPAAGSYYLEVGDSGNGHSIQPYSLTISYTAALDPYDNNDSFGHADDLPLGQTLVANILPRGDEDWHRIQVDHQGELQITASNVPSNLDINFRVWDDEKNNISDWSHPLAQGGDTNGIVDLPAPGVYYIEVADGSGDARSIKPFNLKATFLPSADLAEPNDDAEHATAAELDTTIAANILPADDRDFYKLDLKDAGDLYALITNVAPNLEIAYRLWDDQGNVLGDWVYPLATGGNTEGQFKIDNAGVYYLEVVDNNNSTSIQPYLLRLSMDTIDPSSMTYIQSTTSTDVVTATVSTVQEGTETVTATTTTLTTTVTVQASGEVSQSAIVTETSAVSNTSVITHPATNGVRPPGTPGTPATPGGGKKTPPPSQPVTPTVQITETSAITPSAEVTATESTTDTGSVVSPITTNTGNLPSTMPSAALSPSAVIPEGKQITVEGVNVVLPTGWQSTAESGPFQGIALNPGDLTADAPQGPRLWILAPGAGDLQPTGTLEPSGDVAAVVETPATFQIGEQTAIAIGVREQIGDQIVVRRYVYVTGSDGESYEFILEAPAGQWVQQVTSLEGILASVLIQPS